MPRMVIIDNRSQFSRRRRLPSELATAAIWGLWLSLWQPIFSNLEGLKIGSVVKSPFVLQWLFHSLTLSVIPAGVFLVLISVTFYSRRVERRGKISRRLDATHSSASELYLRDYAAYFQVAETQVFRGQNSSICRIYHDSTGQITAIIPVIPEPVPGVTPDRVEAEP